MAHYVQWGLLSLLKTAGCLALVALLGNTMGHAKGPPSSQVCTAFQDNFDGSKVDGSLWVVANGRAPGYIAGNHIGYYQSDRVTVSGGLLRIWLTQEYGTVDGVGGIISRGGMINSKLKCGYGTYEWNVRMSTTSSSPTDPSGGPISGSVSAGFNYVNNSQTEIDFEFSALFTDRLYMVNWLNTNTNLDPTSKMETYSYLWPFDSTSAFHSYKYVWEPGKITYFVDGIQRDIHATNVPTAPAYFMINHWGTNSLGWGGLASVGVTRYYYIDSVKFTPLP